MPNLDGSGPCGKGPMTGHGRGYCIITLNSLPHKISLSKEQALNRENDLTDYPPPTMGINTKEV
jgi:hypothetical protein